MPNRTAAYCSDYCKVIYLRWHIAVRDPVTTFVNFAIETSGLDAGGLVVVSV